jgi:hypothetical protein
MANQRYSEAASAVQPGEPRPISAAATVLAVRSALGAAVAAARAGALPQARMQCAAVILETQPAIAACPDLLHAALYALLVVRGCKSLSRLVLAISGRHVAVDVQAPGSGPVTPPRWRTFPGSTRHVVDPRWIDATGPGDPAFRTWCEVLLGQGGERDAPEPDAARHLELA